MTEREQQLTELLRRCVPFVSGAINHDRNAMDLMYDLESAVESLVIPPESLSKTWGVKQIASDGSSRWYTNGRHTMTDAIKLARSYGGAHGVSPLTGDRVQYAPCHIGKDERY